MAWYGFLSKLKRIEELKNMITFKSTVNVLKNILKIGEQTVPAIVAAYNPPLGALLSTIVQSVTTIEAQTPTAPSAVKSDTALSMLQVAMPVIEGIFEQNNKAIHNPALFASGVQKLQDGLVDVFNSTGEGTK